MNTKALVVVLFAVLCVAGWFVVQGRADDPLLTPPVGTPASSTSPTSQPDLVVQGVDRPVTAAVQDAGAIRTEAPAVDVGKVPGDKTATVRGRLVEAKGAPRPGIELTLTTWSRVDGIEIEGLPMPPGDRNGRRAKPTCMTRADGTFQFSLAAERDAQLEISADTLVFAAHVPVISGKKGDQDLGDVIAVVASSLRGIVQDQLGRPVADVKIAACLGELGLAGFGTISSTTSAADGTFAVGKLSAGKWTLRTASGKFLPAVQEFTLAAEEQRTDLVVVVKPGQAIAGQVVDERGVGVVGCKVGSKRRESRAGIDIERFTADEATTTDGNGFFTLSGLSTEIATIRAFGAGHTSATAVDVPVGTGNLVMRVERLGVVEGVLLSSDGKPIEGSRVSATANAGIGENSLVFDSGLDALPLGLDRAVATTGDNGAFRIEGVSPGMMTVSASGKTHRPVRQGNVNVMPAQTTKGVQLVADLGASVRVKVQDETGKPIVSARVTVQRPQENPSGGQGGQFFSRSVGFSRHVEAENDNGDVHVAAGPDALGVSTTDAEGIAVLAGLPAGAIEVSATHADFAPAEPARLTLAKSGTVEATLKLLQPGFAEVFVLGVDGSPAVGVGFQVTGPGGADNSLDFNGKTGETGQGRVGPLAPGPYTVMLTRPNEGANLGGMVFATFDGGSGIQSTEQRFTVVAGETARVELRRPVLTRVHGTVTGVDGPVAGCMIELEVAGDAAVGPPGLDGRSSKSAADGTFGIEDVEAGRYTLRFGKAEQIVKATAEIEVPPNAQEVRQDLVLRTGKLRVQACALGTGEAIEGAEVEIVPAGKRSRAGAPRQQHRVMMITMSTNNDGGEATTMTVGGQHAKTDEDGWAVIDDVPAGDYTVRITHKKHAPAEKKDQTVVERQTTECGRIELAVAGRIRGKVLAADGKPAGMGIVQNRLVGTESWSEPTMAMNGNFRIDGLAGGKYAVRVQAMGESGPGDFGPEVEVEVKSGETATTEVHLPAK